MQELVAHRLCQEVRLELLTAAEVEAVAPEAQQCLAVASVAGVQYTAAGLQRPMEDVEGICDALCQQGSSWWRTRW